MTDEKVLTAWNALMLISFAEAARYLRRSDYLDIAIHMLSRPKDIQDNATPSGNALAALAMLELAAYTNRGDWYDQANAMLETQQQTAVRYPTTFAYWLSAMDFAVGRVYEVAVLRDNGDPHIVIAG